MSSSANKMMGNSAVPQYVKLVATGILGATYLSALTVASYEMLRYGPNAPIPSVVSFILGTGVSLALGVLGLHQGASLAEAVPPNVTIQPTPTGPTMQATQTTQTTEGGSTDNASAPTA